MTLKSIARYFLFTALSLISASAFSQEKIALIVAIGDYPMDGGWMKISSKNDVPLIKNALLQQGFKEENISIVADEEATRKGIMDAVNNHLVKKATRGGIGFFHYSGHGQQVMDNGSDETDGYDEAIVPYDSPMRYVDGVYEGENLIRDEELGELFDQVRTKFGPSGNFLTVIDACHSGTGTRGMSLARGTDLKMQPENYKPVASRGAPEPNAMEGAQSIDMAPLVAFFGAAPHQLNFETKDEDGNGVGSLSYAFSKKFSMCSQSTSYRMLFDQIKLEMSTTAPRQQPQAEGTLDQEILGGNAVERVTYYNFKVNHDQTSIVLEAGWLQGIYEGSKIGIFDSETMAHGTKEPIAIGYVEKSKAMNSVVMMEEPFQFDTGGGHLAVVLEKGFGNISISVNLGLSNRNDLTEKLRTKVQEYPIIMESEDAELFVVQKDNSIELVTKDDFVLESRPASTRPEIIATTFTRKMISYGQAKFLRNLDVTSYLFPLEFEIIPVSYDSKFHEVTERFAPSTKIDAAGNLHFYVGDKIQIKVTNNGDKNAYFTIIDIQPDNLVNVLVPDSQEVPADFQIGPGESITLKKVFEIAPPEGTEVFKIIATDSPIDLRPIANSRGGTKSGNQNPFEKLFAESYFQDSTSTRGTRTMSLGGSDVNVFSKVFIIEDKNQ